MKQNELIVENKAIYSVASNFNKNKRVKVLLSSNETLLFNRKELKRLKVTNNLSPDVIALIKPSLQRRSRKKSNKGKVQILRVLFDSGASANLIKAQHVEKYHKVQEDNTSWETDDGVFKTKKKAEVEFILPEFLENREIKLGFKVMDSEVEMGYDIILGQNALSKLGIIL